MISQTEHERVEIMVARDGLEEAVLWARRTIKIYRVAVLQNGRFGKKQHFASRTPYRRKFIESYQHLKHFVEERDHAKEG